MSSNKKSLGTLILVLLLFVIVAGASWFYFHKNADQGSMDEQVAQSEMTQDDAQEQASADDMDDAHAGHNHGAAGTASDLPFAQKGTIHELSVKPVLGQRGEGDPNAPVKIQEFFSLTCSHCAAFHTGTYQEIKKQLIDTGKVYFMHEEFPLNGPALYGSMIARCLPEERYNGFIDLLLRNQEQWAFGGDFKAGLMQNAKLAGMSDEEFETCFNNKVLQQQIAENIKEASDVWQISSTPSFVINNGEYLMSGEQPIDNFLQVVSKITGVEMAPAEAPAQEAPEEMADPEGIDE
ncbi:MAG TPA: thioredoxin domain-containing protein [Alphaproteobacteria bacterium]|nr:thioredoxin domain-containing protein [Alphaproteobacteria bacterium]